MNWRRAGMLLLIRAGIEVCLLLAWLKWHFGGWWAPHGFFWAAWVPTLLTACALAWRTVSLRWLALAPLVAGAVYALGVGVFLLGMKTIAPGVAIGCLEHTPETGGFGDLLCFGPLPIVDMEAMSAVRDALRHAALYTLYSIPFVLSAYGLSRLSARPG